MPAAKSNAIPTALIAPCGMNCSLCMAYIRQKKHCPGCRADSPEKSPYCIRCRILNCPELARSRNKYCDDRCPGYPCARLKQLDKRYRTKYGMSMIENLNLIRSAGVRAFVAAEKKKWACPQCGALRCVHRPQCPGCGHPWR